MGVLLQNDIIIVPIADVEGDFRLLCMLGQTPAPVSQHGDLTGKASFLCSLPEQLRHVIVVGVGIPDKQHPDLFFRTTHTSSSQDLTGSDPYLRVPGSLSYPGYLATARRLSLHRRVLLSLLISLVDARMEREGDVIESHKDQNKGDHKD